MKRTSLLISCVLLVTLAVLAPGGNRGLAQGTAQTGSYKVYFPLISRIEAVRFDDFADNDPVWNLTLRQEEKDGFMEHLGGLFAAHIRDNSALFAYSPGWRPLGDYKLEVDARHVSPNRKTYNGLGLVFDATDDWSEFYALIIAAGGAQHAWAVVRFTNFGDDVKYLTNDGYRGAPNFMKGWDSWNHLMVIRRQDGVTVYCNGKKLPDGNTTDTYHGSQRLVGLMVTSYEFDIGEVEFDNFKLTQLSGPY